LHDAHNKSGLSQLELWNYSFGNTTFKTQFSKYSFKSAILKVQFLKADDPIGHPLFD